MLLVPVEVSPFSEMYQSFNSLILSKPDFLTIADNPLPIDLSKTGGENQDCCNNCESLQKCHLASFSDSLTYFKGSDLPRHPSLQRSLTGSLWNWVKNKGNSGFTLTYWYKACSFTRRGAHLWFILAGIWLEIDFLDATFLFLKQPTMFNW